MVVIVVIVVVSLEGAVQVGADAEEEEEDTFSCISITSTFTSSLLSLGELCLERRPGTLPSSRMREEVNLGGEFSPLGFPMGGKVGRTKRKWAIPPTPRRFYPASR